MLRHNFSVIVLFARMFMVFNRLHFYLGHNFSEVFIFPAGEEEGHRKSQSRHTCPDHLLRHWAMWLWDSKTYMPKVRRVLNYFYVSRSWESSSSLNEPWWFIRVGLAMGMGCPCQVGWEQHPRMLRQAFVQEQDCPLAWPTTWAAQLKDMHPVRALLRHIMICGGSKPWDITSAAFIACCWVLCVFPYDKSRGTWEYF